MLTVDETASAISELCGTIRFTLHHARLNDEMELSMLMYFASGGEDRIRTCGGRRPTHAFQACPLSRSGTSPAVNQS